MKQGKGKSVWITPEDIKRQVQKLWDRGLILAVLAGADELFPLKLKFSGPDSREISEKFPDVRDWIARLVKNEGCYRITWRQVNHRVLGMNNLPAEIWVDQLRDALQLIRKEKEADQFIDIIQQTQLALPMLLPWLRKRPLRALALSAVWPQLLQIVSWLKNHPRPGIYLRELALPGVHTKLVEAHLTVLTELLDLALLPENINHRYSGTAGFNKRYGFREKPQRVRFRMLDQEKRFIAANGDQDITLTADAFASLKTDVAKVFITENEINFLAFPYMQDAMIIFGAGYGFENLASADWLQHKQIYYWGDIDTHGFAILHQLRSRFPHAASLLMNRNTLLAHQQFWVLEARQEKSDLKHLTQDELQLYNDLRHNHFGEQIRLEQERIAYNYVLEALKCLK